VLIAAAAAADARNVDRRSVTGKTSFGNYFER
jgi:hypothetical protein